MYSVETKKEIITQIRQGMPISVAARTYHVARETIRLWLKSPTKSLSTTRTGRSPYDIEVKVQALRMLEKGLLSIHQVADYMKIRPATINTWVKDKTRILAEYSSQGHHPIHTDLLNSPGEETGPVSTPDDKDTKQHIRDLKDENEFLKAKVAYLEALMELNGTPASGFKKKSSIRPSIKSSEEESET